jgi:arsenite methyltransferase
LSLDRNGRDDARTGPGADLLFQDRIRETVRRAYREIPTGAGRRVAERFYSPTELSQVPDRAIAWALGVGNPVRHARLPEGAVVLDLGCGAGIDTVLAARAVGPMGRVIALDTLPEMRDRADAVTLSAGTASWCECLVGEMEAIPLPEGSVDAVISNGVLNLSPRKSRAMAEIARVLKPGGRLCMADLTVDGDLPPEVLGSEGAWAGCIAGAVSERILEKKLRRAGFIEVRLGGRSDFGIDDVALYPLFADEVIALMRRTLPSHAQRRIAVGVIVTGTLSGAAAPRSERASLRSRPSGATELSAIEPDVVEAPGVTVRHLKTVEDVQLKTLDVDPGSSTPFHSHQHAHEGVVISGSGFLRLTSGREQLRPGVVFSINPTDPHAIVNDGPEPLRFICMDCFVE